MKSEIGGKSVPLDILLLGSSSILLVQQCFFIQVYNLKEMTQYDTQLHSA